MNLRELATNLGLEEKEFWELLDLFLKTSSSELTELQSAIEDKNAPVAGRIAHSIKGVAGSLGLKEIYEIARKMEIEALGNRLENMGVDIRILSAKLDLITDSLKR